MTAPVTGRARRPLSSLTAPHRLTALVFATYAVPTTLFGESIPANRGLGYDGTIYASIATRFGHLVRTGGLDSYDVWRALPSGAVWLIFRVFGVASTPQHLMLGFRWVNVIELIASIYVVHLIAQRLSFSVRAEWFVLLGMFGSFFALKWTLFDPVLVDCSGFFLAVVLLWAFLDERPIVLGAVTLLGAFTWPLVFVEGLVLLACPRSHRWGEPRPTDRVLAASLSVVAAAAALVVVGIVGVRFNIVVPPLIPGVLDGLPSGHYLPSLVEWVLSLGLIAGGAAAYSLISELLPIHDHDDEAEADASELSKEGSA